MTNATKKPKPPTLWHAEKDQASNRNYVLTDDVQRCHLCNEIEPPLRVPSGDEQTDRAAMHLVHGVTAHYGNTLAEWEQR